MADYLNNATGNFSAATPWCPVLSAATQKTGPGTANTTTTTTSFVYTPTFTIDSNTYDGILLFLTSNGNSTGTFTVSLNNGTTDVQTLAVNVSDLPTSSLGAWCFFKITAQAGNNAAGWKIGVKSSTAGQVTVYRSATTADWAKLLRNHTAGGATPGTGDNTFILSELTGANASNIYTITMDQTATTSYGNVDVCFKGNLVYGVAVSTTYYLRVGIGTVNVWDTGILSLGTNGTAIPSTSSAVLEFNCTVNVDSGLIVNSKGTLNTQGVTKGSIWTYLTVDAAAAATNLTVTSTTDWVGSDVLCFTPTDQTAAHFESQSISSVGSSTTLTLNSGLTNAHSGTSPTQCEIGNLTHNVKIRGISTSLQGYINILNGATVNSKYTEYLQLGSATSLKRGIDVATGATGAVTFQYCSFHDFIVTSSNGITTNNPGTGSITVDTCVFYNINNSHISTVNSTAATSLSVTNNLLCGQVSGGAANAVVTFVNSSLTFTGNAIAGGLSAGVSFGGPLAPVAWSSNIIHTNNGGGVTIGSSGGGFLQNATLGSTTVYRCGTNKGGLNFQGGTNLTFNSWTMFGNGAANIFINNANGNLDNVLFTNLISNGDTTFATTSGVLFQASDCVTGLIFENASFSQVSGIKTAHTQDILFTNAAVGMFATIISRNGLHGSTLVSNISSAQPGSYVAFQALNQTVGNHKTLTPYGTTSIDTTIYDVSPSERLAPSNASNKFVSAPMYKAVDSGNTVTVTVKVRQSSNPDGDSNSYTGGLPNLKVLKNVAAGIAADTILDTATSAYAFGGGNHGQFQTLSGTTIAVTDDAVLTFVVDCDGTSGWINVDTASAA